MYHLAVQAANELVKDGIECEIIDPRTVKPLDVELILQSVKKPIAVWLLMNHIHLLVLLLKLVF